MITLRTLFATTSPAPSSVDFKSLLFIEFIVVHINHEVLHVTQNSAGKPAQLLNGAKNRGRVTRGSRQQLEVMK